MKFLAWLSMSIVLSVILTIVVNWFLRIFNR